MNSSVWAVWAVRAVRKKKRIWWILSNFWGWFFQLFEGKKKFWKNFKNILATALNSYIKWLLWFFFFSKKFEKVEKTGFFRAKFFLHCTLSVILGFLPFGNIHFTTKSFSLEVAAINLHILSPALYWTWKYLIIPLIF